MGCRARPARRRGRGRGPADWPNHACSRNSVVSRPLHLLFPLVGYGNAPVLPGDREAESMQAGRRQQHAGTRGRGQGQYRHARYEALGRPGQLTPRAAAAGTNAHAKSTDQIR